MPEKALKLVLFFDAQSQLFKPSAHNLPTDQAVSYASDLHAEDGGETRIVEQKTHHRATAVYECGPCKKAAEEATSNHSQTSDEEQQPAAVSAEESEGE